MLNTKLLLRMRGNRRGVSLLIVIFALLVLSILGWSFAAFLSGDMDTNLRLLDGERALYVAESGMYWGMNQVAQDSSTRTTGTLHTLGYGQYSVVIQDAPTGTGADIEIICTGYIPQQSNYRARRVVDVLVTLGSFDKVVQTKELFNWVSMDNSSSNINGDMQCGHYERDNDGVYDEDGVDYTNGNHALPPDGNGDDRIIASDPYPLIDLSVYEDRASVLFTWPLLWAGSEATITSMSDRTGNLKEINVDQNIFTLLGLLWNGHIVRNISSGRAWADADWRIISSRVDSNTIRVPNDSLNWAVGDTIRIGRRFKEDHYLEGMLYVKGDAMLDARDSSAGGGGDLDFRYAAIVAEGDIIIIGENGIDFSERPSNYPSLATQNGNIISTDTPDGHNDNQRRQNRNFGSMIYTENGNITFNYMDGETVIGKNINFLGSIRLSYDAKTLSIIGFSWTLGSLVWKEQ